MKALTKYWFLEGFNLFKKLGMHNMMKICEILEMVTIVKGHPIVHHDEHRNSVFFLKIGSVKIINTTNDIVKYVVKKR